MRSILIKNRKLMVISIAVLMVIAAAGVYWALTQSELAAGRKIAIIPSDAREARLLEDEQGELIYRVTWRDGTTTHVDPSGFAEMIESEHRELPMYLRLLNVTSSAGLMWVSIGLLAQIVFMARMVVQWVASEKNKRSIVPPSFWWLSLMGASMLIIYFIWRRDAIGVLGQATGWVVYVRNLMLLRRESLSMADSDTDTDTVAQVDLEIQSESDPIDESLCESGAVIQGASRTV